MSVTNPPRRFNVVVSLFTGFNLWLVATAVGYCQAKFEAETIDDKVQIGYGIAAGDVNGDGKLDIVLADKRAFVWYENPSWTRHVLTEDLTALDNVCIAVRDIDGDGRVEIAVGALWNPGDTLNSGSVHYLMCGEDPKKPWTPIQLENEPTVHRMRWVKLAEDRYVLVVAPLHGRGNRGGMGDGVKLLAYEMPADPTQPWKTTVIDDEFHMTHNFDPCQWDATTPAEELLYVGREGAKLICWTDEGWQTQAIARIEGSGEIRMGALAGGSRMVATIEPMHGTQLVLYSTSETGQSSEATVTGRRVLDASYVGGHAIAIGDLLGNGDEEIVAGWRNRNADSVVGVKLYRRDAEGNWQADWIDRDGMATEDIRLADLDGDGRLDIIAAGRDSHNLKVYWNRSE